MIPALLGIEQEANGPGTCGFSARVIPINLFTLHALAITCAPGTGRFLICLRVGVKIGAKDAITDVVETALHDADGVAVEVAEIAQSTQQKRPVDVMLMQSITFNGDGLTPPRNGSLPDAAEVRVTKLLRLDHSSRSAFIALSPSAAWLLSASFSRRSALVLNSAIHHADEYSQKQSSGAAISKSKAGYFFEVDGFKQTTVMLYH